jgi:glycosyltransferase involved in cell wall biosynthesis
MATTPYFILSPNTVLSIIGILHGPDKTVPTPPEDWRQAKVDVIIPAFNEEQNIPICLGSLLRQTLKPRKIMLIDDGSSDSTSDYAKDFCEANHIEIDIIRRKKSIGKTPTLKRQARELDSDVEFILDGDTILESENYIERTVEELYKAIGIGSASGTIMPLRRKDQLRMLNTLQVKKFLQKRSDARVYPRDNIFLRLAKLITNIYRDALYMFLQRFIYRGQMIFFGTITNPVGCAVAYRRKYIQSLFDTYEQTLGDDLTNSEDIFIGFSLINEGYRNIQLQDIFARSEEPIVGRLPRQIYKWSSSFLQSCYYFSNLTMSPFKVIKRWRQRREQARQIKKIEEKRRINEPYRQPFGVEYTKKYGRPMGWTIFLGLFEKIFFPIALLIMIILQLWEPLLVTVISETAISSGILLIISRIPGRNRFSKTVFRGIQYFFRGIFLTPLRYLTLLYDLVTITIFTGHIWVFKTKRWRK